MYLSSLLIDVGDNPDRPRPGRLWLRNLYHVHQRLCMAFPSASQKTMDPDFLKPFNPVEFAHHQVHVTRQVEAGFLFRVDPLPGGRVMILVQSALEPDWDYAFQNARHLLAAPPATKSFEPYFTKGQSLRFRLLANPTKKVETIKKNERQNYRQEEFKEIKGRHGRRLPVPCAAEIEEWRGSNPGKDARLFIFSRLFQWLHAQAEKKGFSVNEEATTIQPGYVYVHKAKSRDERGQRLRAVRFDGLLHVTDSDRLRDTVIRGIGPGKAYGLGLLSLAPP